MQMQVPELDIKNRSLPGVIEKLCMRIVLDALTSMKAGSLMITLPDGTSTSNRGEEQQIEANIRVHSYNLFQRCILFGAIGFAESYIAGEWSTNDLTAVIKWFILNGNESTVLEGSSRRRRGFDLLSAANRLLHLSRPNTKSISKKNISAHYDLSNELFSKFLDSSMTYSSAVFYNQTDTLEQAQVNKYERICRALKLDKHDQVLEIGCGWGGFASYAAKNYGCSVVGITIAENQFNYARQRIKQEKLQDRVEIRLQDYRDMEGKFDKIASIEMVEALGDRHVDTFFSKCSHLLTENGLLSLQMITTPDCRYEQLRNGVDFIQKHIFPGSLLLSIERVVKATSRTSDLHLLELYDFADSYARTLNCWARNFESSLDGIRELGFSDEFIRKWRYYFAYCEAAFAMRQISVVQMTLTRPNNELLCAGTGTLPC